ncbi:hypothetical protein ACI3E1_07100 [Ligilactobacillus sp. LYQ139]
MSHSRAENFLLTELYRKQRCLIDSKADVRECLHSLNQSDAANVILAIGLSGGPEDPAIWGISADNVDELRRMEDDEEARRRLLQLTQLPMDLDQVDVTQLNQRKQALVAQRKQAAKEELDLLIENTRDYVQMERLVPELDLPDLDQVAVSLIDRLVDLCVRLKIEWTPLLYQAGLVNRGMLKALAEGVKSGKVKIPRQHLGNLIESALRAHDYRWHYLDMDTGRIEDFIRIKGEGESTCVISARLQQLLVVAKQVKNKLTKN